MSASAQMTCQELVELVTEYFEGVLREPDRARFEAHLETCPYCVNYLDQMRVTVSALGALEEDQLSGAAREALLAAFRDWKRTGTETG